MLSSNTAFHTAKIGNTTRYGEAGPEPKGTLMTATFQLEGQEFMVLNGDLQFKFTKAVSFFEHCETQEEVDELWEKLLRAEKKADVAGLKIIRFVMADHSCCLRSIATDSVFMQPGLSFV